MPSKALLAAAETAQAIRTAGSFGLKESEPDIDFSAVKDHVSSVIRSIEPHDSVERFESLGVQVLQGTAAFSDADTVMVGNESIQARYFVLATGSRPAVPPIEGLDPSKALTNETLFDLREKPEHLVIIGGGPIGMEMAQAHRRLGSQVSVIDMGTILQKDDPDLVSVIRKAVTDEGIKLYETTPVNAVKHHSEQSVSVITADQEIKGSHLLIATGRVPNTENLGLDKAGIVFDRRGITVNNHLRTTNKKTFALGDVAGGPQFTHIAGSHAGIFIQKAVFKSPFAKVDYKALPWVTYTDPELAQVGLTEHEARERYGESVKTTRWSFEDNDRARAGHTTNGLIKIVTNKRGLILGAGIAGRHAGELIGLWGLAISKGLNIRDVATMIAPYPTLSEVSKRAAGAYFTPALFSQKTRKIVKWLQYLPF